MIDELVELVEGGHEIGAQTVDAVLGALESNQDVRDVFDHVVWRHRGKQIAPKTVMQKAYVDAIRSKTVTFGIGPAGTGKTYLAMALAVAALQERQVGADHPHAPRGRGRRAARLPARRHARQGRPVPAPALRRALRHARPRAREHLHGARHDRGGAAGIHAGSRAAAVDAPSRRRTGFRPIGDPRVGDLVTGSDGRPTPVHRRVSAGPQGGVPRAHAGRRLDPVLRRASLARVHAEDRRRGSRAACSRLAR